MTTKITVTNQKGGTGKTTTAVSLAHGLALAGKDVLLIDLDPQGQASVSLGLKSEPGAYYLLTPPPGIPVTAANFIRQARERLWLIAGDQSTNASQRLINDEPLQYIAEQVKKLIRQKSLDYVIFDTAPSVGGIQERAIWAGDLVLIPAATDYLAADGTRKLLEMLLKMQQEKGWPGKIAGILPTMYSEQEKESRAQLREYQQVFGRLALPVIHRAAILRECPGEGRTIFEMKLDSEQDQRALDEYGNLVKLVRRMA